MSDIQIRKEVKRNLPDTFFLLIFLFILFIFFSFASPNFATYANISSMLNNMVISGIIAIAITPLIVAQGLDISFGASLSLSTVLMARLYEMGWNTAPCLIIGFVFPVLIGLINGVLIEFFNLIPLILTLATSSILIAIGQVMTNGQSILMIVDKLFYFATESFLFIPYPVIIYVAVCIIYWFFLNCTKIGSMIYFIGANPKAAKLSGIKVKRVNIMLYVSMGVVVGIASITMLALSGIGYIYHGDNLTLPVLSGVFLGGMTLDGGKGSIWNTIIGITIISVIFTGLSLMNIQFYFIQVFQGLSLVIIVAFNEIRENRRIAI